MPSLVPRGDDDNYLLPKPVIVLIVIFGALCLVVCGYAIHRTFGFAKDPNEFKHMSDTQANYMAEVRIRNMDSLRHEGRRSQWARSGKTPAQEYREG